MNGKQYNNVIDWTLKHEQSAQTEDPLATARAIFNNMGVALPNGSMKEVYESIKNGNYMSWKSCTMREAQQAADSGTAAIGINENRIVVFSAADEEEPVTETAAVMALSENISTYAVADLQYYAYYASTRLVRTVNGWLKLYEASSISGRTVTIPDGCNRNRWFAFEEQIKINSEAQKAIGDSNIVRMGSKGELLDEYSRYWVAVGPKVMNPSHPDDKRVFAEEMNYGSRIEAKLKHSSGQICYLRAVVGECKNHTYPNGIYQTGRAFPNGGDYVNPNGETSVIEFCGARLPDGLGEFSIESIIVEEK